MSATYKLFSDVDLNTIGFREQITTNEKNKSRVLYMSSDVARGFSRDSNLTFQAAHYEEPLVANYDISPPMGQPVGAQKKRWYLAVPVGSELDVFMNKLDDFAKEQIRIRAAEAFPKLKTTTLSDDQLQMVWPYGYKADGKMKLKIILPPDPEDIERMSEVERERALNDTTKVYEVTSTEGQELTCSPADALTALKKGCKVLPVISTNGVWLNDTQCGLSFVAKEVLVWSAPTIAGPACFNLSGMVAVVDKKRTRDEAFSSYDEYDDVVREASTHEGVNVNE